MKIRQGESNMTVLDFLRHNFTIRGNSELYYKAYDVLVQIFCKEIIDKVEIKMHSSKLLRELKGEFIKKENIKKIKLEGKFEDFKKGEKDFVLSPEYYDCYIFFKVPSALNNIELLFILIHEIARFYIFFSKLSSNFIEDGKIKNHDISYEILNKTLQEKGKIYEGQMCMICVMYYAFKFDIVRNNDVDYINKIIPFYLSLIKEYLGLEVFSSLINKKLGLET